MKYRTYRLIKILFVLFLLGTSSCKPNISKLIAGEEFKIWELHETYRGDGTFNPGFYYFNTNGRWAYFVYYSNIDRRDGPENRIKRKSTDSNYDGTWHVIDRNTIEFIGSYPWKILKLNEDTLHLYCDTFSLNPNLFLVKSKDQTPIEGFDEMVQ